MVVISLGRRPLHLRHVTCNRNTHKDNNNTCNSDPVYLSASYKYKGRFVLYGTNTGPGRTLATLSATDNMAALRSPWRCDRACQAAQVRHLHTGNIERLYLAFIRSRHGETISDVT